MISVPSVDPVGALVPHTLKNPLDGAKSGPLTGTSFMVKDLFAIEERKVSNGNPDFYEHATPARDTAPAITRLLEAGASCTGITVCDEFFYSVLGTNVHYGSSRALCPNPSTCILPARKKSPAGAMPSASSRASRSNRRCCPSFSRTT
jgi:Asp-tRNA(Asn)/Glu-tRNA(Gln) amidotransferase A subunit family amidase